MEEGVRIDKWLWAVRVFKTRNQATLACRSGKVRISDQPVKPSREVKIGEMITISLDSLTRSVKVLAPIEHRVGAKLVEQFMVDLTPQEEYNKLQLRKDTGFGYRLHGLGRPTKKERRDIEILKKYLGD
ncbi:MAG: RNA-binding S4 domain-containing protein [Bacteroidales bacterium]|jgi:ribosome-associated heat shock protein Hsp15